MADRTVAMIGRAAARTLAKTAYRLCFYSPHWRIGWRFISTADVWDRRDLGGAPWRVLPNPAHRFFADPFPVAWQGRIHVFFEDFDHRLGKGVISAVGFGPLGPVGEPFVVLEEPWHLSYPFIFRHDHQFWMIPESSSNRTVSLYRAEPFPYRWIKEIDLLRDIEASDATVILHNDRFWMFATVRDGQALSFSDSLYIYLSSTLFGPWKQHPANPVLVDPTSARPAGNMIVRHGRIWRPVQDCGSAYGAGIGLAEITRLDETGFEQAVQTRLRPGREWPGRRLHTLNRSGSLECIDGSEVAFRHIAPWLRRGKRARSYAETAEPR